MKIHDQGYEYTDDEDISHIVSDDMTRINEPIKGEYKLTENGKRVLEAIADRACNEAENAELNGMFNVFEGYELSEAYGEKQPFFRIRIERFTLIFIFRVKGEFVRANANPYQIFRAALPGIAFEVIFNKILEGVHNLTEN